MKKIILFLLLLCTASFAQLTVVGDTTDLKNTKESGMVILEQFGKGNTSGGGFFRRIDSTYAEGTNAFDYYVAGYQWVRLNLVDQYVRPSTANNTVLIWNSNAYTPIGLDSMWVLTNVETDSSLNYYGTIIAENDNATSFRVKGKNVNGNDVQSYMGIFYSSSFLDNGRLATRAVFGGNDSTDLELQSSNDLLLSAVTNGNPTWGAVVVSATDSVIFSTRTTSDLTSSKYFIIDRVDKTSTGSGNTSDVELAVSSGSMSLKSPILIQDNITATDSSTSMILKSSDGIKWKLKVAPSGAIIADSTGIN